VKTLILGGSKFLGVHLVNALIERGHAVTLFNRGISNPTPRTDVEFIKGDRDTDLRLLSNGRWDAVIDTSGFVPRIVKKAAKALSAATGHYTFISSISAYADPFASNRDEDEPLATMSDPAAEEITNESYGPLKALCEREIRSAFGGGALIVRPGLIVGPHDPTDRFTYWPHRFAQGGNVLVPGTQNHPLSFIDVRDLAEWIAQSLEVSLAGTFNAAGHYAQNSMGDLVRACLAASENDARAIWVSEEFVAAHRVTPWAELPCWLPAHLDSMLRASSARAQRAGLRCRPLPDTVGATLAWTRDVGLERALHAGLSREREVELLAAWSAISAQKQRGLR
jgi:2'-hydroxyisoflavone reductase